MPKLTKEELVAKLKELAVKSEDSPEFAHPCADQLLVDFIDDDEVRAAYGSVYKWYE